MRGKGLLLYRSWRKAKAQHEKPRILQDRDCSAQRAHLSLLQGGRTARPCIPCPRHTESNFPAEKTSSALRLGVRLSPPAAPRLPCPRLSSALEADVSLQSSDGDRGNEKEPAASIQSHSHTSVLHPPRLPALARSPLLTDDVLIPHQRGCITSWQPLSIQPQL